MVEKGEQYSDHLSFLSRKYCFEKLMQILPGGLAVTDVDGPRMYWWEYNDKYQFFEFKCDVLGEIKFGQMFAMVRLTRRLEGDMIWLILIHPDLRKVEVPDSITAYQILWHRRIGKECEHAVVLTPEIHCDVEEEITALVEMWFRWTCGQEDAKEMLKRKFREVCRANPGKTDIWLDGAREPITLTQYRKEHSSN